MQFRTLGATGVQVSELCLGAMMFGAWGNPDHDESVAIIHRAFDAGVNFIDTADVYSAGESEQIVGKAIAGRRDEIVVATKVHMSMGSGSQHGRELAALDHAGVREQPPPLGDRRHRPVPDPSARSSNRYRRDARRADGPGSPRQGPVPRFVHLPGVPDGRGAMGLGTAGPGAVRGRATAVFPAGAREWSRGAPDGRERYRMGSDPLEPAGRRLVVAVNGEKELTG